MLRTVLLSKADELYLQKCAQEHQLSYGVIIGHQAEINKSIVVHLARNNEEDADSEDTSQSHVSIDDINSQALAAQWLSASRMCPGSCDVIGIFVSSVNPEVVNEQSAEFKNAKKLFSDVYDTILKSCKTFGVYTTAIAQTDYVFMAYSLPDKKLVCKNYSYGNGGTFSSIDCRFVEKDFEWIQLECSYNLDDVIPIQETTLRVNIEEQFQNIILTVRQNLIASEVFFYDETVDDTIELQAYIKKKKAKYEKLKATITSTAAPAARTTAASQAAALELLSHEDYGSGGIIPATIVLPLKCQLSQETEIKVREFSGTLRMSGIISARIFCNPRNSIADVKRYVRDDVLRSLITRIQVYCDGLTDPHVTNEALFISEPPRRVFFKLPTDDSNHAAASKVQFSEYLFRGEAPTVVVSQAKQILDVELDPQLISIDVEGMPDDSSFSPSNASDDQLDAGHGLASTMPKRELSRSLYMLGIAVALLVLLASVALNYLLTGQ